jgi:hypothetical protein
VHQISCLPDAGLEAFHVVGYMPQEEYAQERHKRVGQFLYQVCIEIIEESL